jgi:hypothetical protein
MIATAHKLGIGVYTPQEAALYARVRTQTISRWILGNASGDAVVQRQITDAEDRTVTFLDFVQTLAIRAIRTQYKNVVSLQKIRAAADAAQDKYGVDFPFARPHSTYIITEGRHAGEIVIRIGDDDEQLIQITGKNKDQHLIGPIAELYLEDVTFGEDDYAAEYRPWSSNRAGSILMNPHLRFGEPLVEQCGYSASALWEATIAEGGVDAAASAYGVDPEHVKLACSYFDHLLTVSA